MQLCGDAHVSNFGLFASPERSLVFDINDFDETLPGPWEWDVKRLVASLAVVGGVNGFTRAVRDGVIRACAKAYRERMRMLARMGELDVWYAHTVIDHELEASVNRDVRTSDPAHGHQGAFTRQPRSAVEVDRACSWAATNSERSAAAHSDRRSRR